MDIIVFVLDHLYYLFYGWNGLDLLILALAFYLVYRLGKRKALEVKPSPSLGAVVIPGREYNAPAILRNKK